MQIKAVTFENLKNVTSDMLGQDKYFRQIEDLVYQTDGARDPDDAKQTFLQLTRILETADADNVALLNKYQPLLAALRLMGMMLVKDPEKENLLRDNIVTLLAQDYADLQYWLKFLFIHYEYEPKVCKNFQTLFIKALESSNETLGSPDITLDKITAKPAIKNWLLDYNRFSALRAQRDVLNEIVYINENPNARALDNQEKELLKKLFRLYNWLKFQCLVKEELPEQVAYTDEELDKEPKLFEKISASLAKEKPSQTPKYKAVEKFKLPGLDTVTPKKPSVLPTPPQKQVPPKPVQPPPQKPAKPAPVTEPAGNLTVKSLGPYVLGGTPEEQRAKDLKPALPRTPVPVQKSAVPPVEPGGVATKNYPGFSSALVKDVEDFSDTVKNKAVRSFSPPEPQAAEPFTNPHALEDILEKTRLKADAKIPLSEDETKAIIDLVRRKKESHQ